MEMMTLEIMTLLQVLKICLAETVGKIIKEEINNAPITFMPITTVKAHKMEIMIEQNSLCLLVDLKKVSSKVNANILLYNTINVPMLNKKKIPITNGSIELRVIDE